jgi:antitoxin (DNA-binding transcriptional repressor) of toxin-antitoxin stability system
MAEHQRNPDLQLDDTRRVIHSCITMQSTASVRDLRNHFPKVRKMLESEGEVLLTESGTARYRLTPYSLPKTKVPSIVNYWARLTAYQPEPISAEAAKALNEENRGDR